VLSGLLPERDVAQARLQAHAPTAHAPGLTPRAGLETLSGILMLDVPLPLADGRELVLPRYTQPEPEQRLVLEKLGWEWPAQPPPRIRSPQVAGAAKDKETKSEM